MADSPELYDSSHFDPPAPIARVVLRSPRGTSATVEITLLIDTGADATLLPRAAVVQLGVPMNTDAQFELAGFDGSRSFASSAELDLIFPGRAFRGRYLVIDDADGILGRDVLNHASLLFDGPRQQWSQART